VAMVNRSADGDTELKVAEKLVDGFTSRRQSA
jgi:hypothetical protein